MVSRALAPRWHPPHAIPGLISGRFQLHSRPDGLDFYSRGAGCSIDLKQSPKDFQGRRWVLHGTNCKPHLTCPLQLGAKSLGNLQKT